MYEVAFMNNRIASRQAKFNGKFNFHRGLVIEQEMDAVLAATLKSETEGTAVEAD